MSPYMLISIDIQYIVSKKLYQINKMIL